MASIHWLNGVVLQFDADGLLVRMHKVRSDADGVELVNKLQKDNPTHSVVYIQGPVV